MTLAFQDSALPEPELRDAYQLAAQHVPSFARAFNVALSKLAQGSVPSEAQWQALANELWPLYLPIITSASADARASLKRKRVLKAKKPIAVAPNARAVEWAKRQSAKLVVEVKAQTKKTIREAIAAGTARGSSVRDVARELKDTLPLLPQHARALRNFRTELQVAGESERAIKQKTDRYKETLKRYRAENVARTETVSAQAEGRLEAWKDAQEAGELPANVVRVWVAAPSTSKRLCAICEELGENGGQETTLDGVYDSSELGEVPRPPAHPSCRCTEVLRVS